jgi:hypothetical protein
MCLFWTSGPLNQNLLFDVKTRSIVAWSQRSLVSNFMFIFITNLVLCVCVSYEQKQILYYEVGTYRMQQKNVTIYR